MLTSSPGTTKLQKNDNFFAYSGFIGGNKSTFSIPF